MQTLFYQGPISHRLLLAVFDLTSSSTPARRAPLPVPERHELLLRIPRVCTAQPARATRTTTYFGESRFTIAAGKKKRATRDT